LDRQARGEGLMGRPEGDEQRLRGWKAIAAFLKADERTAKRWERTRGLPVQRMPGEPRAPVFAFRADLERWLRSGEAARVEELAADSVEPPAPRPEPARRNVLALAGAGAAAALALGAGLFAWRRPAPPSAPADLQARRAWIDAEYALSTRTGPGVVRANALYRQVLEREPGFIPAQARLAVSYNLMAQYDEIPGAIGYARAEAAAQRAIAADGQFAGGYAARGFARFYGRRDAQGAMADLARAVDLDPASAEAWQWLALISMHGGDQTLALTAIARAERLDPRSRAIQANRALITMHAGRWREAEELLLAQRRMEGALGSVRHHLASLYLAQGRYADYLAMAAEIAAATGDAVAAGEAAKMAQAFARAGPQGLLQARRDQMAERGDAFRRAGAEAMLGRVGAAFAALDEALAQRQPETIAIMVDLPLAAVRRDPRFGGYAVRAGFTPEALMALAGQGLRIG
jgi:tetratricopeptide (TPR) repeat protein